MRTPLLSRLSVVAALALSAFAQEPAATQATADTIFHGGDIVTIDDAHATAEALAVRDGRIAAVGSLDAVMKLRGERTTVIDLKGRCLLPGFLDGHSHFINALSTSVQANVYAPPFGPGNNVPNIVAALKALVKERAIPAGEFVMAYGYDGNSLEEGRELCAADLDPHFPDHLVMVQHVSLHGAVLNSAAMKKYGVTAETKTPPGGVILRKEGSNEPAGLLMETAWLPIFSKLPKPSPEALMASLVEGQKLYAAAGITTAHEGASHTVDIAILQQGAREKKLFLDVIAFPFVTDFAHVLRSHPKETWGRYDNGFKLGGVKVTLDGSPQGRTAFFTTPYLTGGPGGEKDWHGEPTFPQEQVEKWFEQLYGLGLQVNVHCNGDAAVDMFLHAHEKALGKDVAKDHRTAVIHSQFVRKDQLEKYRDWKVIPSFYTEHTFFFGSTHVANRGEEQAAFLSPMRTALSMGIRCSNHTDFNVAPIDQMFVVWTAVNRVTREGTVLGPDERITPLQALRAITLDTAYWYREEKDKGSLEAGKLADLVVLDKNPLAVEPMAIKDIVVVETWKAGKSIYRRP